MPIEQLPLPFYSVPMNLPTLTISDSGYFYTWVTTCNLFYLGNQGECDWGRQVCGAGSLRSSNLEGSSRLSCCHISGWMPSGSQNSGLARLEMHHHPTLKKGPGTVTTNSTGLNHPFRGWVSDLWSHSCLVMDQEFELKTACKPSVPPTKLLWFLMYRDVYTFTR